MTGLNYFYISMAILLPALTSFGLVAYVARNEDKIPFINDSNCYEELFLCLLMAGALLGGPIWWLVVWLMAFELPGTRRESKGE